MVVCNDGSVTGLSVKIINIIQNEAKSLSMFGPLL